MEDHENPETTETAAEVAAETPDSEPLGRELSPGILGACEVAAGSVARAMGCGHDGELIAELRSALVAVLARR